MTDLTDDMKTFLRPTPARPLLGQTVLVVEDSRFAGEALRLMLRKSGARCRRADSLRAADRHLKGFRPGIVIVDPGLPDGSGLRLLETLRRARVRGRGPALVAVSGDPGAGPAARAAGADTFIEKPLPPLGNLQAALLSLLPETARRSGPRDLPGWVPAFDARALAHDLAHVADLLYSPDLDGSTEYIAGFAAGLGRCSGDSRLAFCAERLRAALETGQPCGQKLAMLAGVVRKRLEEAALQGHATSPRGRTGHQLVPVRPHFGRISG